MDATVRDRASEFAKEFARNISTAQELSEVMRLMSKSMIERMLQAEMDVHLSQDDARPAKAIATAEPSNIAETTEGAAPTSPAEGRPARRNRRNGTSPKTVQGEPGRLTIDTPRD